MARTASRMRELGTALPSFSLIDTKTGRRVDTAAFSGAPAIVVAFICNHCPFVQHIREELAEFGREMLGKGVSVVAISSNDSEAYPADGPDAMAVEAERFGYDFPYLFDADQSVAKLFEAVCTPDFFVFDAEGKLAYRGQFDDSRPGNGELVTGSDLWAAVDALLGGKRPVPEQRPSIGCNIKWRPGNEPDWLD